MNGFRRCGIVILATVCTLTYFYDSTADAQTRKFNIVFKKCIPELEFDSKFELAPVEYVIESQLTDDIFEFNGNILKYYGYAKIASFRYFIPGNCDKLTLRTKIIMKIFVSSTRSKDCQEHVIAHEMEHIKNYKSVPELTKKYWLKVWNYTRDFGSLKKAVAQVEASMKEAITEMGKNNAEFDTSERENFEMHRACQKK